MAGNRTVGYAFFTLANMYLRLLNMHFRTMIIELPLLMLVSNYTKAD